MKKMLLLRKSVHCRAKQCNTSNIEYVNNKAPGNNIENCCFQPTRKSYDKCRKKDHDANCIASFYDPGDIFTVIK